MVTQERDDAVQAASRSQGEARSLRDAFAIASAAAPPPQLQQQRTVAQPLAVAASPAPPAAAEAAADSAADEVAATGPPAPPITAPGDGAVVRRDASTGATPLEVVQRIRRDRGYDLVIPSAQVGACLTTLYASLDSALQKLAVDIYSSDSRFVLELIQNADDNGYASTVQPTFRLQVTPDQVRALPSFLLHRHRAWPVAHAP